jgi:hypothetical protein
LFDKHHKLIHILEDPTKYQLKDSAAEKKYSFSLQKSLLHSKSNHENTVFKNVTFYMTPSVVPPVVELTEIIEAGGGKVCI